jgi:hypothetical protein
MEKVLANPRKLALIIWNLFDFDGYLEAKYRETFLRMLDTYVSI